MLRLTNGAQKVTEKVKALFTYRITRSYLWKVKAEVGNFRKALDQAQNPLRFDRRSLYAIYREVELDDQVITQRRIAAVKVQQAPFEVMVNKTASDDAKAIFENPWFFDFLEVGVVTEYWGHSLLEFLPERMVKGQFTAFNVIQRDHVRPEYGDVLLQISASEGIPYRDPKEFPYVFEIGRPDDLGLYHVVAVPAIRKRYSDTDWSLFSERYGSPFLTIKTQSRDKKELDAKEAMAANFASNGYAILDEGDDIQMLMANPNGTAHLTFRDRMDRADDQIAKVMNGQTGASDEKAFVGSAEVHERLLDEFTFSRLTRLQNLINFQLIPFLISHGYAGLQGARFEFIELRKKEKTDLASEQVQDKNQTGPSNTPAPAKRKQMLSFEQHYQQFFTPEKDCC